MALHEQRKWTKGRLEKTKGQARTEEAREYLRSAPTKKLREVMESILDVAQIAVLTETHIIGEELNEVIRHFAEMGLCAEVAQRDTTMKRRNE